MSYCEWRARGIGVAILASITAALSVVPVDAAVRLPAILSDHAVLKRSSATKVWGTAAAGEAVTVQWSGRSVATKADENGNWSTTIDLSQADATPFELVVTGSNELRVKDVLAGEVWLASGQSNLEFHLSSAIGGKEEIAKPARPQLRFFSVGLGAQKEPAKDVRGKWQVVSPQSGADMSAVAYFFAQRLQQEIGAPVGIIQSRWGGSNVEAWTSPDALDADPVLKPVKDKYWLREDEVQAKRAAYTPALKKWLTETGRQDRPASDASAFASPTASAEGWTPVEIGTAIKGNGLPSNGAIWLRREVEVPENLAGRGATLTFKSNAMEQVYWNGKLLRTRSIDDYFDPTLVYLNIAPELLKAGKSVLVMRLYAPLDKVAFNGVPGLLGKPLAKDWTGKAEYALADDAALPAPPPLPPTNIASQRMPRFLYNAMIAPLTPTSLSGVIWYQGEDNTPRAAQYRAAFPQMILNWRSKFDQGDLPFLFCQLPAFGAKRADVHDAAWAELREAQTGALKLPNTGQVVLTDTGEAKDIHPLDKRPAGERLANLALHDVYGKQSLDRSGPVYESHTVRGDRIVVRFKHRESLRAAPLPERYDLSRFAGETAKLERNSPGSELEGFQICGPDKKWVWAKAQIDGDEVVVSAAGVTAPLAIRYAWADNPTCNLTDASGLPTCPFRTDDFPPSTANGSL